MNPVSPLRYAFACLSVLVMPMSLYAEEPAAETQPQAVEAAEPAEAGQPEAALEQVIAGLGEPAGTEDISFSIGYTIGTDMASRGVEIDADQLASGIRAGLGIEEARLTEEQISHCLFSLQMQMQQKHFAQAEANMTQGLEYLNENAAQEGVTVTESGLQYRVIESGDGASPTMQDTVAANYRGTLIDGTEFDSSPEGEPVQFPVGRVIPGWIEALQLMKVGDKWELTIPSELAYGENGTPDGRIGPNQVLRFEIELVEIQ